MWRYDEHYRSNRWFSLLKKNQINNKTQPSWSKENSIMQLKHASKKSKKSSLPSSPRALLRPPVNASIDWAHRGMHAKQFEFGAAAQDANQKTKPGPKIRQERQKRLANTHQHEVRRASDKVVVIAARKMTLVQNEKRSNAIPTMTSSNANQAACDNG